MVNWLEKTKNRILFMLLPSIILVLGWIRIIHHMMNNYYEIEMYERYIYIFGSIWFLIMFGIILWSDIKRNKI